MLALARSAASKLAERAALTRKAAVSLAEERAAHEAAGVAAREATIASSLQLRLAEAEGKLAEVTAAREA